jgi:DNA polymerase II large subunit
MIDPFTRDYQQHLLEKLEGEYQIASTVRRLTNSPADRVETIFADTMEKRVELLVGPEGVAEKISRLKGELTGEQLAFKLCEEIVYSSLGRQEDTKIIKQAICTALAVLTPPCITAAPSEGIAEVRIKENDDGTKYLAIYFAGPIRAAGGTELAAVVVLADYVRRLFGLDRFKARDEEVHRFVEELRTYVRRVMRFQYNVPDRLVAYAYRMTPVEITGVATDRILAPSYRNLPRIETDYLRGGALRVVNDGIVGRAKKVLKLVQSMGISGWSWIEDIVKESASIRREEGGDDKLSEVIGGRPVFSLANRFGGLRIRYGRAFATGMSALGVHPMTLKILDDYLVVGTQLKTDYPGKGGVVVPVEVEPPVVKTLDGEVVRVTSEREYARVAGRIERVLFLGDILVSVGDCIENNVELKPSGYCEEWWAKDLAYTIMIMGLDNVSKKTSIAAAKILRLVENPLTEFPSWEEAVTLSKELGVPLHPRYLYFWENLTSKELEKLRQWLKNVDTSETKVEPEISDILVSLLVEHKYEGDRITLNPQDIQILKVLLNPESDLKIEDDPIKAIEQLSGIRIRGKSGSYITARMGRPEKAGPRQMKPAVHILFPVGLAGGGLRDLTTALKSSEVISVELVTRRCSKCGAGTWREHCPECNAPTFIIGRCSGCGREYLSEIVGACSRCGGRVVYSKVQNVNLREIVNYASQKMGELPDSRVSGVRGLSSMAKVPEDILKGLLRAKYGLYVYKDGTIRFDATNAPLTHFTPAQIGTSVEKLRALGYLYDVDGMPLTSPNQVCELMLQDLVMSRRAGEYLLRVSKFIDDYLVKAAGLPRHYNCNSLEDLVGCLVVGLSPHTYVGVLGRVIGFVDGLVNYAHPVFHAAKRRDCDGDEDSVMLLLDVLINFSPLYIPDRIGGRMDSPLLITRIVYPDEVDEQAHNVDTCWTYPLQFYEASLKGAKASEISHLLRTLRYDLKAGTGGRGVGYTHVQRSLTSEVVESAYKRLKTMHEKISGQLTLVERIESVRHAAIIERIVDSHILPDIVGNVRAYMVQTFRCKRCGKKFRRMPLTGKCPECQMDLVQTVFRGAVEKYVSLAKSLAETRIKDDYLRMRTLSAIENIVDIFKPTKRVEATIGSGKQLSLESYL